MLYLCDWAIRATRAIGSVVNCRSVTRSVLVPPREHDLIALAVALEGVAVAVGLPAVELEDEVVLRPEHVGFVPVERHVRERLGELGLLDELEKAAFALGPRETRIAYEGADHLRTAAARLAGDYGFERL